MTNKEAIEKLVNAEYADKWQGNEELTLALHMAIDALESEPVRHGRLIDADALMRMICGNECGCTPEECGIEENEFDPCACNFRSYIADMPTIEAEPVVLRMPDLIERSAAIDNMCGDCKSGYDGHCPHPHGMCHECESILQTPKADITAVNRWIPCSERLPEENVYVLAWAKRAHKSNAILSVLINGIWKIGVNDCSDGFHAVGKITHWMPLPEPPEREVQDDD